MITISNLNKQYKTENILSDINLTISKNSIVGLLGKSGSGKSTLLKLISGLEKPSSGTIHTNGKVNMVFQDFQLFPHMTIIHNLTYTPIKIQKYPKKYVIKEAKKLLERFNLIDKKDYYPNQLSSGQKQRVAIARALITKPEVIALDEPTSALDPEMTQEISGLIQQLSDMNITIILATHELSFIQQIAERIIFIENRRILVDCTTQHFFRQKQNTILQNFIGEASPRNNNMYYSYK